MSALRAKTFIRRQPRQLRARQTVDAILEAVVRILKREGMDAITTNHISEIAGVSIGSLYQYFPDKKAIFAALHERHIQEIDRIVQATLMRNVGVPLDRLMSAMVDAMIEAHSADPELHELLSLHVPDRVGGSKDFAERLHGAFLLALSARSGELKRGRDLEKQAFVLAHMVESLCHAVVRRRRTHPPAIMKAEIVRAIMAYLRD